MKLVPDLDERLSLGVAPGQAGRFQFVGPKAPLLSSIDRPIGHHAAIGQGVEDRDDRLWRTRKSRGRRRPSSI